MWRDQSQWDGDMEGTSTEVQADSSLQNIRLLRRGVMGLHPLTNRAAPPVFALPFIP